ncbi:hypothetical protein JRQ81_007708 [Phrynocephalus forsythii]|uniref:Thyroid adenoma-associated protein homolog n=1 Tax=Phrynocephalus forsythii TaxID=171643 RepID=A0A9Q1ATJ1_9SAUR|nr:hypothetical protein JRQ81_007708 [Phrynocephalus forsythii]
MGPSFSSPGGHSMVPWFFSSSSSCSPACQLGGRAVGRSSGGGHEQLGGSGAGAGLSLLSGAGPGEGKSGAARGLILVLDRLEGFASVSVKRCKDKYLEEALQRLAEVSGRLGDLDADDVRPLVGCVLAFQLETTNSSGSFCRLEKVIRKLTERNEALVSEELDKIMGRLVEDNEPMSPGILQTVCMFVEESTLGRCYWENNLTRLFRCTAATFDFLLQEQGARDEAWHYVTVKVCLQLFKWMPKEISLLVWDGIGDSTTLERILGSLLQITMEKAACKDTRLLAGTALSMLANTAPHPQPGAQAVWVLYRLLNPGGGPNALEEDRRESSSKEEWRFGGLRLLPPEWNPDGLARLVLTRSLLASGKKEILSCQVEGMPQQACLLLDILFPVVLDLMDKPLDSHYYCFQVLSLWLERVRESLEEIWKIKKNRVLADNSSLLQGLSHILWNHAESPVEGVSDFIRSSFEFFMEIYSLECRHFGVVERPLYGQFLQRITLMPWQVRARYFALTSILPHLGPGKVLDLYQDLPQHLLNCLSTNHLCPVASDVYKTILQLQRKGWTEEEGHLPEEDLAQKWAHRWLPTLSRALTSPDPFLQSNAGNYLLVWTLRLFPASYALLAGSFGGRDSSQLRAWGTLLKVHKARMGALPEDGETLERLAFCLCSQEDHVRLAALGLLCSTPKTNQALSKMEVQLLKEFLPLNLNGDSSSFRQLLQAMVKKALVRLRDSSLAVLKHQTSNRKGRAQRPTPNLARKDPEASPEQAVDFVEWLWQLCISSLTSGPNYQRKKTALLLLAAILETCTDSWSPERKKGQPPRTSSSALQTQVLLTGRSTTPRPATESWLFHPFQLADSPSGQYGRSPQLGQEQRMLGFFLPEQYPDVAELLIRQYKRDPRTGLRAACLLLSIAFPRARGRSSLERAKEAVSSPRVQEVEAGAVLMKTLLQKSDGDTLKQLLPAAKEEVLVPSHGLYFLEHLLRLLHVHFSLARQDLLQAAHTTPMHGVISALRRCLLEVPEISASMQRKEEVEHWQSFLSRLVDALRDISRFLLRALQNRQSSGFDQQAAAPSFADMGYAIGGLIQLGKDLGSQDEDDSALLSEEHSLILTCCWVSVKEIGLLLGGLAETVLPLAPPAGSGPLLPLHLVNTAAQVFQDILLKCRHWGAVEGCSLGFTKFCIALLRCPDPELQAVPKTILAQGLSLLSSPRSCSVTRRAAGFPMLFLCIASGEDPAKSRPLLADCIQTLLALASEPLPQDWDQTVDLPQVSAIHVLQTLVRGSGALTVRLLGQNQKRGDSHGQEGMSPEALFGCYPQLRSILLQELISAAVASDSIAGQKGKLHLCPSLYAVLTFLAKLQPSSDTRNSLSSDTLLSITRGLEDRVWLLGSSQKCPLVRTAYLQVVSLLMETCSPSFPHSVREIVKQELLDWKPTETPCFSPVQVGLAAFRQHGVRFLCHEARRLGGPETAAELGLLLRWGSSDVQVALLTWLIEEEEEEETGLHLSEALWLTLLEKLRESLKDNTDHVLLKLYLEAFVQLYENLCAQSSCFLHKPLGTAHAELMENLLSLVESDRLSPELLGHAMCGLALLLTLNPEDDSVCKQWCGLLGRCSQAISPEVLRRAASRSLKIAGPHLIQRTQASSSSPLQAVALGLIDAGVCLLQDEDQEVRKEASVFASLLVQQQQPIPGVPPRSTAVLLHTNKALHSLLTLLLEQLGGRPETFTYLVRHLPTVEASDALAELETKGAVSLYKEDDPNVYAEPAVLSQILLPFLRQLLARAATSPELWQPMQCWLKATGPGLFSDLQLCRLWWGRDDVSLHLKALVCSKVHVAIAGLLVKATLVTDMLEKAEAGTLTPAGGICLTSRDLRGGVRSLQKLLARHGMAPAIDLD